MPQVVIDPGHGGTDPCGRSTPLGARTGATWEKHLNLRLAERVAAHLAGEAMLTRADDRNVALGDRAGLARASRARAFVSLHGHAGSDATQVYLHPRAGLGSRELASAVQRELGARHAAPAVGDLAVLHPDSLGGAVAGCLVECTYPVDAERLLHAGPGLDRVGAAIARGVRAYLGSCARPGGAPVARATGYRGPAAITIYPASTAIAINNATSWMSEHFLTASAPGDISLTGQVTAQGPLNDPGFTIQVNGIVGTPGAGVHFQETFPLVPGTPLLFGRTVALPAAGSYRIVFFMADWNQPPSSSVTGSFFL